MQTPQYLQQRRKFVAAFLAFIFILAVVDTAEAGKKEKPGEWCGCERKSSLINVFIIQLLAFCLLSFLPSLFSFFPFLPTFLSSKYLEEHLSDISSYSILPTLSPEI